MYAAVLLLVAGVACEGSAQDKKIIFTVIAPPATPTDSKIYIAGNNPLLGNWNPGSVLLRKLNDSLWSAQFAFPVGTELEYKITRGKWNTQAVYVKGIIPANSLLTVLRDTQVVIRPVSWSDAGIKSGGGITGTVRYHRELKGEGLNYARDLIVWLPPSYEKEPLRRYPVLYMHDGQNIIDPATSFIGFDWKVDEMADSLIRAGKMQEIIVVGIYNSPDRIPEYSDTDLGRAYAAFVVRTVKPLIDSTYRTKPDKFNTAVMGSSMGGLISFLMVRWYPDVFSKAGCLSSVFAIDRGRLFDQVEADRGGPGDVKIYTDCGGAGNEGSLKPGMDRMVALLESKGYKEHKNLEWFYDPAAQHNEQAWAARLWRPLLFFFGTSE